MKKLLSGHCPGYRRAFELMGSDAMWNWDWPEKLDGLPEGTVWPTIIDNQESLWRFKDWADGHGYDHVLWHNEPAMLNPGAAVALAEWTNAKRAELIAQGYMSEKCASIVGNFLIRKGYPGVAQNYSEFAAEINWFMGELDFPAILGVHLYNDDAESPIGAWSWHENQLCAIHQDHEAFAVTEWGDLSALWRGGEGPDISAYSQYMRACWEVQMAYNCYASAWYVGCASDPSFANADYVLTNQDGTLRPLGEVWRDLPMGTTPAEEPPKPGWVTVWSGEGYRLQREAGQ